MKTPLKLHLTYGRGVRVDATGVDADGRGVRVDATGVDADGRGVRADATGVDVGGRGVRVGQLTDHPSARAG
eukprot:956724-Pyramimonas_sp.AAC.1